jgi:hypothetical protein
MGRGAIWDLVIELPWNLVFEDLEFPPITYVLLLRKIRIPPHQKMHGAFDFDLFWEARCCHDEINTFSSKFLEQKTSSQSALPL